MKYITGIFIINNNSLSVGSQRAGLFLEMLNINIFLVNAAGGYRKRKKGAKWISDYSAGSGSQLKSSPDRFKLRSVMRN